MSDQAVRAYADSIFSGGDIITVDGTATMQTLFMSILEVSEVQVAVTTKVKRAGGGLLVSLVLDNTGSMWGGSPSKIVLPSCFAFEVLPCIKRSARTISPPK